MGISLTSFHRDNVKGIQQADIGEKIGDFGFGLLRLGFGKTVEITKSTHSLVRVDWQEGNPSPARIAGIVLSIVLFPVTAILAGIGSLGYACSKSREKFVDQYQKIKTATSQILKLDISKEKNIDKMNELFPGYAPEIEIAESEVTPENTEAVKSDFVKAVKEQSQCLDTKKLRSLKTTYLKMRDLLKIEKHHSMGIPDPSLEIPLASTAEFHIEADLPKDINKDPSGSPKTNFPPNIYRYDHPRDSEEGLSPAFFLLGGKRSASAHWKTALEYVEKEVLTKPLKEKSAQELLQLLQVLHSKIVGKEEKLRDQFSLVADPSKSDITFPDFKAYLQQQPEGESLVKRMNRLEQKIGRWGTMEKAAPYVTPKQWGALQQVVFCPPSPFGLDQKAVAFMEKVRQLMNEGKYHPIQIAAFIHYGLTSLHLFEDGNGRLSRLFTNIYLMQNGFEPFYVVNDSVYTDLYRQEKYDVSFYKFLLTTWKAMHEIEENEKNAPVDGGDAPEGCKVQ
jgi:prophage maintenance system killer protein